MVTNREVRLTPIEYSLLCLLAQHAGKVLTYAQILHNIRGRDEIEIRQELHVYLSHLRGKLQRDPSHRALLVTVPGVGIRLPL